MNKYNNKDYKFNTIEIVSAGERLDESEGIAGMSASKIRKAALDGNVEEFMKGFAGRLELEEGIKLMNLIRSRIQITDDDKKKFLEPLPHSLLSEIIKKSGNKWCLFSKTKGKDGKRKKLGCYSSRNGAKKRERQVQYFKHIKEEQELEEMSAAGSGAVTGHVFLDSDEVEEQKNVYLQSPTQKYGTSLQKRDDEPSRKDIIKVLIMQEEQFMINRKEFVEEIKLRKIVREGLKRKMKEKEEKILQEEKQLRLVIKKLLQEKEEEPPHPITGINVLRDLLKKIVPTIETYYKQLTTDKKQRDAFRAHLVNATTNELRAQNSPEEKMNVELKEQENEEETSPALQKARENEKFIDIYNKKSIKQEKPKSDFEPESNPDDGLDTTGRDMAMQVFRKIKKQIADAYAILSDQRDKDAFSEYLITNQLLHMDIFEDDMKPAIEQPSTPSYEQEKGKQQLDSETPEQQSPLEQPDSPDATETPDVAAGATQEPQEQQPL